MENSASFGGKVLQWPVKVKEYFIDLQQEMRRVTWPPWKQVRATTGVVIVTIFAFALYFLLMDQLVLGRAIDWLLHRFTR